MDRSRPVPTFVILKTMTDFSFLQVRNPKEDETPIASATQIFASVLPYPYIPLLKRLLFVHPKTYAFRNLFN